MQCVVMGALGNCFMERQSRKRTVKEEQCLSWWCVLGQPILVWLYGNGAFKTIYLLC